MAWDSGTSDNVSRRSTAQSDVAPRTVNRRVLRSDDALFTYSDKALLPVADRGFLGHLLSTLVSQSADYTLLDSDGDYTEVDPGAADKTITLPTAADNDGRTITVRHIGTGAGGVILDGEGDEEVNGAPTFTLPDGGSVVVLRCNGTSWTWIGGHIVGSNSNGKYVLFSSGLQVCWCDEFAVNLSSTANQNIGTYGWSYYYNTAAVTFPKEFGSAPVVIPAASRDSGTANGGALSATASDTTTTGFTLFGVGVSSGNKGFKYIAIGLAS